MAPENYHHDNLKSELIEKGLRLLDQEGYEGFSLRKVAKACNASHAAPYRHFRNKDELIVAIAKEAMGKFSGALQQAVDKYPNNPKYQLKEMGCAYVEFFAKNPEYLRLMFLSDLSERFKDRLRNNVSAKEIADQNSNDAFEILSETVKRYKADSAEIPAEFPPDHSAAALNDSDPMIEQEALLLYCWGLVHGIAILTARKDFPYQGDYVELARKVIWSKAF